MSFDIQEIRSLRYLFYWMIDSQFSFSCQTSWTKENVAETKTKFGPYLFIGNYTNASSYSALVFILP